MFLRSLSLRSLVVMSFACLAVSFAVRAEVVAAEEPAALRQELLRRLDVLAEMPGPRPGIASRAYMPLLGETREWLAKPAAQETLLRELPKLSTRQLVTLWDVLWIKPSSAGGKTDAGPTTPRDMDSLAIGLARKFNDAAIGALADEKETLRRRLFINMVKPQAHTLTEKQATEFLAAGGWKE
jgi:hypothetical protein